MSSNDNRDFSTPRGSSNANSSSGANKPSSKSRKRPFQPCDGQDEELPRPRPASPPAAPARRFEYLPAPRPSAPPRPQPVFGRPPPEELPFEYNTDDEEVEEVPPPARVYMDILDSSEEDNVFFNDTEDQRTQAEFDAWIRDQRVGLRKDIKPLLDGAHLLQPADRSALIGLRDSHRQALRDLIRQGKKIREQDKTIKELRKKARTRVAEPNNTLEPPVPDREAEIARREAANAPTDPAFAVNNAADQPAQAPEPAPAVDADNAQLLRDLAEQRRTNAALRRRLTRFERNELGAQLERRRQVRRRGEDGDGGSFGIDDRYPGRVRKAPAKLRS